MQRPGKKGQAFWESVLAFFLSKQIRRQDGKMISLFLFSLVSPQICDCMKKMGFAFSCMPTRHEAPYLSPNPAATMGNKRKQKTSKKKEKAASLYQECAHATSIQIFSCHSNTEGQRKDARVRDPLHIVCVSHFCLFSPSDQTYVGGFLLMMGIKCSR